MDLPFERVLALVSGLPRPQRQRRLFMALQAYIDDSMTADAVLVLAGYVASLEQWLSFSDEWQQRLDMKPRWPYFKMSEVGASEDPERWERAGWFYRVIEDHAQAFATVVVEIEALRRVVRELGLPDLLENPYVTAYRAIVDFTSQYQHELGITDPIDFIFDEHGQADQIRRGFEVFKKFTSPELLPRLGRAPRFEKDTEFLPLQAADLLAWHVRKHWLKRGSITSSDIAVSWPIKKNIIGYKFELDYENLKRNLLRLRQRLQDYGHMPRVTLAVTFTGLDGRKF